MHVALASNLPIPPRGYGGIERVIWWLGRELARRGHTVTFLVAAGSSCPFARVLPFDAHRPVEPQIPRDVDLVHFHNLPRGATSPKPYLVTMHGNTADASPLDANTVFLSREHASRFGSTTWVHNGLDPGDYGPLDLSQPRRYVHFLGNAAWKVKNVRGAITVARQAGRALHVLGGRRLNFRMGFRLTLDPRVRFHGSVDGERKIALLAGSAGLVFPVRWAEPFGLAVIESLVCGCPVFATPYGALPELVAPEVGVLSTRASTLADAVRHADRFDARTCHAYAMERFSASAMVERYLELYARVLDGETLNAEPPRLAAPPRAGLLEWAA
jgi:glycosyltransferase involved in cell wall biosynthesis